MTHTWHALARNSVNAAGRPPQLYLVVAPAQVSDSEARVEKAFACVRAAVLLIEANGANESTLRALVTAAQRRGIAALIDGDAELARKMGADGVHVASSADLTTNFAGARGILGGEAIVGADAGGSRHDAMTVAEAGADYVAFGIPAHAADNEDAAADRLELVQWWAEIFEVPVVAFDVATADEARDLAQAGAEFIAVRIPAEIDLDAMAEALQDIAAALAADTQATPA